MRTPAYTSSESSASSRRRNRRSGSARVARSRASTAWSGNERGETGVEAMSGISFAGFSLSNRCSTAQEKARRNVDSPRLMVAGAAPSSC